jgi:hypothetical protein
MEVEIEVELVPKVPIEAGTVLNGEILAKKLTEKLHRVGTYPFAPCAKILELAMSNPTRIIL